MSAENGILALRLDGPLQSWGCESQYNRRNTGLMPTKSAIAGMCCAAFGHDRGSDAEQLFLSSFNELAMIALAIPRERCMQEIPVRRLVDYHTVGGGYDPAKDSERNNITIAADDGKPRVKNGQALAVLTHRFYLLDASFGVLLEGDTNLLKQMAQALNDPVWGLWLGRKTCIPSAPVLVGLFETQDQAIHALTGKRPLSSFTRQKDVTSFAEGRDSLPDKALSFALGGRRFAPRRIRTLQRRDNG